MTTEQDDILIVKGTEHPEEFDHSKQDEGLLLREIVGKLAEVGTEIYNAGSEGQDNPINYGSVAKEILAEVLKHRLDRPKLREKIKLVLKQIPSDIHKYLNNPNEAPTYDSYIDQILAPIPDIEEAREQLRAQVPNLIAEAKEQEREGIRTELKKRLTATPDFALRLEMNNFEITLKTLQNPDK